MVPIHALRLPLTTAAYAGLLLAPLLMMSGCSQGQSDTVADLQQRLTAAEARADAAEKRAKNAETLASQHAQEPPDPAQQAAPPEIAQNNDQQFGQPAMDTAPIVTAPAIQTQPNP